MVVGVSAGWGVQTSYAEGEKPEVVFTIRSPQISESSSLAVSTVDPGLVYTTNDSGDNGTVYALDASTGAVVGRTTLADASPLDVEAITAASDGTLIVADIGDNDADHSTADLYRIGQPGRGDRTVTADRVDLTYVDGPRDAESVLYDALTGRAYVVSKLLGGAKVYATPPDVFERESAILRPVAGAPAVATDATFLPGGDFAVIRTYVDAEVYTYPAWEQVATFTLPAQEQGESITAPTSGDDVWVGSEGGRSAVFAVALPDLQDTPAPQGSSTGSTTSGPAGQPTGFGSSSPDTDGEDSDSSAQRLALVVFVAAGAGLVLLVVVALLRAARRRTPSR